MTEQQQFMALLKQGFEAHGIEHMVVGSVAADWLGHPRTTQAVDVILSATRDQLVAFVDTLKRADLYLDEQSVLDAWQRRSMANAIDPESGWKVDLIMLDDRPFSRAKFDRRVDHETAAGTFSRQTAEDLILSKLLWCQQSESERQLRDAGAVFDVWRSRLDVPYLRHWAADLRVVDLLDGLFERPVHE